VRRRVCFADSAEEHGGTTGFAVGLHNKGGSYEMSPWRGIMVYEKFMVPTNNFSAGDAFSAGKLSMR